MCLPEITNFFEYSLERLIAMIKMRVLLVVYIFVMLGLGIACIILFIKGLYPPNLCIASDDKLSAASLILSSIDESIDPCEDFYRYSIYLKKYFCIGNYKLQSNE